ncbi:MAG: hypothetical protein JWP82_912 [Humibacillus sp.]|nr:hypothetical protein [Humibacillus sp.]
MIRKLSILVLAVTALVGLGSTGASASTLADGALSVTAATQTVSITIHGLQKDGLWWP